MGNVKRIYPDSRSGLINWVEQNFHDIDQFVVTFSMKDGTTMTVYDTYSYVEAVGLAGLTTDTIHAASHDGTFTPKIKG